MKVFSTRDEIAGYYGEKRISGPGFVPTMGALHEGHLSLVREAKKSCPVIAVSIFVNPTQFNDPRDLEKYPRTLEEDLKLLENVMGAEDFVFAPQVKEIYPEPDTRKFDFGNLERVMEGIHRPGHFNGVAQVVSKLFDIIEPSMAFFGQKDFQQLAIIRELARRNYQNIKIIACPIIREPDGLAMSSRNRRLLPEHRREAGVVYKTLRTASELNGTTDLRNLKESVTSQIEKIPGFKVEYFEIVDDETLTPLTSLAQAVPGKRYYGCIALFAGEIRLIDNIEFKLR